jgi:hypothetical protein
VTELHRWGHPIQWILTIECRTRSLTCSTPRSATTKTAVSVTKTGVGMRLNTMHPLPLCLDTGSHSKVLLSSGSLLPVSCEKSKAFRRQITLHYLFLLSCWQP